MNAKEKKYALVTGAGQGLGKAFAYELAKRGINLIMVSLPGENLKELSREIARAWSIDTVCYETDLSVVNNVLELADRVNRAYEVFMLINNAGTGGSRKFQEASPAYINTIIQVNVTATSLLTHQLLPNLLLQPQSYILNVSSMAAFSPIGYKTVYPASKTFVHSFSRGLNAELRGTNVFVSVVNPGAMKTNPEITKRVEKQGKLGKISLLDPGKVAEKSINGLFRKDSVIMVNPFSWLALSLIPVWIKLPLMTRAVKREVCA
ncbi:MAG TPA: short-chain dehydrogenase [Bacteroidales bacterium]|jgi:short-subunit dehydrogenase|nr:short-chain dehydrogenase [Bacteroidales bacterium]